MGCVGTLHKIAENIPSVAKIPEDSRQSHSGNDEQVRVNDHGEEKT